MDSKTLFTDKANAYAAYRPSYPSGVFEVLRKTCPPPAVACDIGAGTGIFSKLLAGAGYQVFAVEPNPEMRAQAAALLGVDPNADVIDGSGEATTLADATVDLISVAQAFHWLDPMASKREFARIAHTPFTLAIAWNSRAFDANAFMSAYQGILLQHCPRYLVMKEQYWNDLDAQVQSFLQGSEYSRVQYPNPVPLSRSQMLGNLLSASYAPREDEIGRRELLEAANTLFDSHSISERVELQQRTILYTASIDTEALGWSRL